MYENAMAIGRFHGLHNGHVKLVRSMTSLAVRSIVFVGSAQESGTERNPFSIELRMRMLEETFQQQIEHELIQFVPLNDMTHEEDVSHAWGRYLISETVRATGKLPDLTVHGKEASHQLWYSLSDDAGMATLSIPRNSLINVSATELRWYVVNGDYRNYTRHTPETVHSLFDELRAALLKIPYYQRLLENRGIEQLSK